MRVDLILPFVLHYSNELASLFEKCIFCLHICVGNLNVDYRLCHHQASPFAPLHHYLPRLTRTCVKENFNIDYTAAAITGRLHHLLMDRRTVLHARIVPSISVIVARMLSGQGYGRSISQMASS